MKNLDQFIKKAEMGELSDDDLEQVSGGLSAETMRIKVTEFGKELKELHRKYITEGKSIEEANKLVMEALHNFCEELLKMPSDSYDMSKFNR